MGKSIDFNDLQQQAGCKAVALQIESAAPVPALNGSECHGKETTPGPPKVDATNDIKTMEVLRSTVFAAISWVIVGLLPEGLAILSGPPKIGKSWLVMALCIAVAVGERALSRFRTETGDVLLLSLEDNLRRVQGRLLRCLDGRDVDLSKFHVTTTWRRLDQGGLDDLAKWLEEHPSCKLVIIDTIQKIKAHAKRKNGNAYENDYDSYGELQRLALLHRVCILVIHHNRKSDSKNDSDPLEQISGSTGITGSMDTILMLSRPRGMSGAVLTATGRDIAEAEYGMTFNGDLGQWVVSGKAEELSLREDSCSSQLLAVMKASPGAEFTVSELFELLDGQEKTATIKQDLYRLAKKGVISNNRGKFAYYDHTVTVSSASLVTGSHPPGDTSDAGNSIPPSNINDIISVRNNIDIPFYSESDLFMGGHS